MKTRSKKARPKLAPKSKAKKPARKKEVILPVAAKEEWYRVDTEVPRIERPGQSSYTYTEGSMFPSEEEARRTMEGMKLIGVGGRLVHLDGSPDGRVVASWGDVERMAEAERLEKASLGKPN